MRSLPGQQLGPQDRRALSGLGQLRQFGDRGLGGLEIACTDLQPGQVLARGDDVPAVGIGPDEAKQPILGVLGALGLDRAPGR